MVTKKQSNEKASDSIGLPTVLTTDAIPIGTCN